MGNMNTIVGDNWKKKQYDVGDMFTQDISIYTTFCMCIKGTSDAHKDRICMWSKHS